MTIKEYSIKDENGNIVQSFGNGLKGKAMAVFEQLIKNGKSVRLFEYTINTSTGEINQFEIFYNWGE